MATKCMFLLLLLIIVAAVNVAVINKNFKDKIIYACDLLNDVVFLVVSKGKVFHNNNNINNNNNNNKVFWAHLKKLNALTLL